MRTTERLTLDDVAKIVAAAKKDASSRDLSPTIAVVDRGGALLFLERPDTNSANTVDMAVGKAKTAAFRERPSSALEERVKTRPGFLMTPNQIGVRGGVPIFYKDECVGGLGVSGIGNDDDVVAELAAKTVLD